MADGWDLFACMGLFAKTFLARFIGKLVGAVLVGRAFFGPSYGTARLAGVSASVRRRLQDVVFRAALEKKTLQGLWWILQHRDFKVWLHEVLDDLL